MPVPSAWDRKADGRLANQAAMVIVPTTVLVIGEIRTIHQSDIGTTRQSDFDNFSSLLVTKIRMYELHFYLLLRD
jgi:hypothetical protein